MGAPQEGPAKADVADRWALHAGTSKVIAAAAGTLVAVVATGEDIGVIEEEVVGVEVAVVVVDIETNSNKAELFIRKHASDFYQGDWPDSKFCESVRVASLLNHQLPTSRSRRTP